MRIFGRQDVLLIGALTTALVIVFSSSISRLLDYARRIAKGLAGAALYEFDRIFNGLSESRDALFIRALASWVLKRAT